MGSASVALPDGATLLLPGCGPSMTAVLRAVKRLEHSLFNCLASIVADAQFVRRVAAEHAPLPLLANLRCGRWYAFSEEDDGGGAPAADCYFKSTDGHVGQWAFSTARLNLHVVAAAAAAGGAVVVDATRRGKTFPDALSRTVPIWAAVLNRAALRLRRRRHAEGAAAADPDETEAAWRGAGAGDVHLPPWVPASEAAEIGRRLDGWVDELLEVAPAGLGALLLRLRAPLRCVWASQAPVGGGGAAYAGGGDARGRLPPAWTPLVLVSASLAGARARRSLKLPARRGRPPLEVVFEYVPGAGDDEESWAAGLAPAVAWRHRHELLRAGPRGAAALAARLQREAVAAERAAGGAAAGGLLLVGATGLALGAGPAPAAALPARPGGAGADAGGVGAVLCLCREEHPSMRAGPGAGSDAAAAAAAPGGAEQAGGAGQGREARYLWLPPGKPSRHALLRALPAALRFACLHLQPPAGGGPPPPVLICCETGGAGQSASACVALACLLACFELGADGALSWAGPLRADAATGAAAPAAGAAGFSRVAVRRHLAALTAHAPGALPSQAQLKAVFNAFLERSMARPEPAGEEEEEGG